MEVQESNLIELLEAERLLENFNLKMYICEKVFEMLTIKNCFFYFKLSEIFYLNDLQDFLLNTFFKFYITKFNLELFRELTYTDLVILISSSKLQTDSELEVFNCVVDWINYKKLERRIYIDKLLSLVRLPLLTNDILVNCIRPHPLCSNNLKYKSIVDKALKIKKYKTNSNQIFYYKTDTMILNLMKKKFF